MAGGPTVSRPELWTANELEAFLAVATNARLEAAWHLLATRGLRVREVLALQWTDVDSDAGRISVPNAVVGVPYTDLAVPCSSTASRALDARPVLDLLDRHHRRQEAERSEWGAFYRNADLVICCENGRPLHPRDLHRAFGQQVVTAGLRAIGLADLRRSGRCVARRERVRS